MKKAIAASALSVLFFLAHMPETKAQDSTQVQKDTAQEIEKRPDPFIFHPLWRGPSTPPEFFMRHPVLRTPPPPRKGSLMEKAQAYSQKHKKILTLAVMRPGFVHGKDKDFAEALEKIFRQHGVKIKVFIRHQMFSDQTAFMCYIAGTNPYDDEFFVGKGLMTPDEFSERLEEIIKVAKHKGRLGLTNFTSCPGMEL